MLFYFRWAAAFTVLTGVILAWLPPYSELDALLFQTPRTTLIGIGMWLGLIMAFNVWFIIWPNQKKALGIVPADDACQGQGRQDRDDHVAAQHPAFDPPCWLCMTNAH